MWPCSTRYSRNFSRLSVPLNWSVYLANAMYSGQYGGQPRDLRKLPRYLTAQRIAGEIQVLQIDELAEFGRNRAAERVPVAQTPDEVRGSHDPEIQHSQFRKLAEFGWNRPAQEILGKIHLRQSRKLAKFRWDGSGQMVVREIQVLQIRELAELGRYRAVQPLVAVRRSVAGEIQAPQVRELAELTGNRSRQPVAGEVQVLQTGEPPQFRRDRPVQMPEMAGELQAPQAGKLAQLGWNRPPQPVLRKNQGGDPPGPVSFDAVPFRQRRRAEPSRVLPPVLPCGRLVERFEGRPIRRRQGRRQLARVSGSGRRIRAAHREREHAGAQEGGQDRGGAGPGNETFHAGLAPLRTTPLR